MPQQRQLAAIMFADIVGYTALMGEDEEKAFTILRKNRQLQKPLIEKYGGKWMKEIGRRSTCQLLYSNGRSHVCL